MKKLILIFVLLLPFSADAATGGVVGDSSITPLDDSGAVSTSYAYLNVDFKWVADSNDIGDSIKAWGWSSSTGSVDVAFFEILDSDTLMLGSAGTINVSSTTHQYYGCDMNVAFDMGDTICIGIGNPSGSIGWRYGTLTSGVSLHAGDSLPEDWNQGATDNISIHMYAKITNATDSVVADTVGPGACITQEWSNIPSGGGCNSERMDDDNTSTRYETGTDEAVQHLDDWDAASGLITLDSVGVRWQGAVAAIGCPCDSVRVGLIVGTDTSWSALVSLSDSYAWYTEVLPHPRGQAWSLADTSETSSIIQAYDDNAQTNRLTEWRLIWFGNAEVSSATGQIIIIGQKPEDVWDGMPSSLRLFY